MSTDAPDNRAESVLVTFDHTELQFGPGHNLWEKRVGLEIENLRALLGFLEERNNALWFFLMPHHDPKFQYRVWNGHLKIPTRKDIQFDLRVVLTSEYPRVFPRAFVEESLVDYAAGNLYVESRWEVNESKPFVMICHDHIKDQQFWSPNLSIAHFLLREIWMWWNAKSNTIINLWDEQ